VASLEQNKIRDGWLKKWSESGPVGRWNKKWLVVTRDIIFYFNSKTDKTPGGYFEMSKYNEVEDNDFKGGQHTFKLHNNLSSMTRGIFSAETEEEKNQWISVFKEAIKRGETQHLMAGNEAVRTQGSFYIRVAEARNLVAEDLNGLSDPYCIVQVGSHVATTQTIWKSLNPLWAEEFTFLTDKSLPKTKAVVTVFDRNEVGKDELIGTFRMPMTNLLHQQPVENWWPLEHMTEKNFVSGEVRVECVYRLSASQVDIKVIEARGLTQKDSNGYSDPFVKASHGGAKFSGPVVKKTLNPVWNFSCSFKVTIDTVKDGIKLVVRDWDMVGASEFMGAVIIPLATLPANVKVTNWYALTSDHFDDTESKMPVFAPTEGKTLGDIRLRLKYTELKILKLDEYDELWKLIHHPSYAVVDALGEVTTEREDVAKNLVRLFQGKTQAIPLLIHLCTEEVKNTPSAEVIFRGNSIATKAVDAYMKLIGGNFLRKVLGKKIKEIVAMKKSSEIDPTRLNSGESVEENQKHLAEVAKSLIDLIFASADDTPIELRLVFSALRKSVVEKFGEGDTKYTAVSGFIFLRFWGPAILGPKLFGLLSDHPGLVASRTFTLCSKTLQTLGNLAQFGAKEPYMAPLNKVIEQNQSAVKNYLDSVSSQPTSATPTQLDHIIDVEAEMAQLYYHLQRDQEKIVELGKKKGNEITAQVPAVVSALEAKYNQHATKSP